MGRRRDRRPTEPQTKMTGQMKIHLFLAAVAAAAATLLPSTASAASVAPADGDQSRTTIGIRTASHGEPDNRGKYEYELFPKQTKQDAIAVYNYSVRPVTVRLLARDATSGTNGAFSAQPTKDQPRDVGAWIAISKPVLHLQPRSMTVVPIQIGVPYNATPGDHAGSVLVSLLAKEPKAGRESIVVEHRVGLRVYLRVPGTLKAEMQVQNLTSAYEGSWTKSLGFGRPVVDYTVRNTGNVRLSATQQVEILRSLGLSSAAARPPVLKELLPGGSARVHQAFDKTWAVGNVTARVTLAPAGLDESVKNVPDVVKESSVFVFPWLLVLVVLLLVGGGVAAERRRRRLKALRLPGGSHRTGKGGAKEKVAVLSMLAVVLGVGLAGLSASPAAAAGDDHPIWKATVLPRTGGADDPIELMTSGGCPRPADSILGKVYGKGFPKDGENVIGNTRAGVTPVGPFEAPLAFSMKEFMSEQPQPVALSGTYRFVVNCRTAKFPKSYADYVAEIRFTGPNRWVAAKPVTNETGQVLQVDEFGDPVAGAGGTKGGPNGGKAGSPSASPPAGATPGADGSSAGDQAQAAGQSPAQSPALTPADGDSGNSSVAYLLIVGGVLVAVATAFVLLRRRA